MLAVKEHIVNGSMESAYSQSVPIGHRKKFAQFFTPYPIAELMAKWLLGNPNLKYVLEPAFGLGIFTRALLSRKEDLDIKGFDIDETIIENANVHFEDFENVSLRLQDYIYNDWENKYDGIICNPPYFKFHDYDNKNFVKEIENKLHCKLNGFTNLYTLFLLKSIHQLRPNGRCAYIVPSEFLNSDYGKLVKTYLVKSKMVRHIIVVDFEENVFDDALTTASIIFCANDPVSGKVQFSNVRSLNELGNIEEIISAYPYCSDTTQTYPLSELNPAIKWKAYYQKQNGTKFKNLVPFSTYAKVVRGIATGSNEYFTFNPSKAKEFSIDEKYLLPCICKATDSKKPFFTVKDFEALRLSDKNIFLLNAIDPLDKNIAAYLQKGVESAIDKKFLTASRTPWYSLENRPPAPILVSVFNRTGLRFVRNEANVSNLTSYHCIYPKQNNLFFGIDMDLLFAYLLTSTARTIFEDNSREYGNGLQKFEPNDINKGMMLDLGLLNQQTIEQILSLHKQYRTAILSNESGEDKIEAIDKIFIDNYS